MSPWLSTDVERTVRTQLGFSRPITYRKRRTMGTYLHRIHERGDLEEMKQAMSEIQEHTNQSKTRAQTRSQPKVKTAK